MVKHSSHTLPAKSQLKARAYVHRRHLTHSESTLWQYLTGSQLGVAFRRQVPIGRYIADFAAPSIHLIVEVDGQWHQRRIAADDRRDSKLTRMGYRVLRLDAALVVQQPQVAIARIREAVAAVAART
jgi:very-short-patch-repair endonuclease